MSVVSAAPAKLAGTWEFDPAHTRLGFLAPQMVIATVRGVTRPVELTMTYLGVWDDPWGGTRAGFKGTGKVNRTDWGVTWIRALEAGGVVVGNHIDLELDVQAIKKN